MPLTLPVITAAVLGLAVTVTLWWAYFDVVAPVAERVLTEQRGKARARLARDSYTFLHFPMVAGIICLALGLKKVTEYVADTGHHSLSDPLSLPALWALFGGVALYLVAHLGFRKRNIGSINRPRAVTVVVLLVLPFAAKDLPALAALGLLATVMGTLIVYEVLAYAAARRDVRRQHAH